MTSELLRMIFIFLYITGELKVSFWNFQNVRYVENKDYKIIYAVRLFIYYINCIYIMCSIYERESQSYAALCDPIDYTVRGILQARILEWVAFPFSRGSSQPKDWTQSPAL